MQIKKQYGGMYHSPSGGENPEGILSWTLVKHQDRERRSVSEPPVKKTPKQLDRK
jgi:hypothetical protein